MSNNSKVTPNGGVALPAGPAASAGSSSGPAPVPTSSEAANIITTAFDRLRELEALFLGGPLMSANETKCFSTETLLDVLMVLYNECGNSSLRKEKTVSEFIELGEKAFST